eukprot:SAG25_NODE_2590_length_1512_cov_1.058033_1_plen_75_part_00
MCLEEHFCEAAKHSLVPHDAQLGCVKKLQYTWTATALATLPAFFTVTEIARELSLLDTGDGGSRIDALLNLKCV